MALKRKIAAILAADIAGYSRLVAEDEEETLRRLAVYSAVFEDLAGRVGGRVFKTAGDGFFAEFPSAVDAIRCAIDIQESIRNRNAAYPESRKMAMRMGLTMGDVVDRDGDLLGDAVNIAARLETLAEPGRICISKSVYEAVANKLSVQFRDLGPQQVKNIPNPVHVFSVATGEPVSMSKAPLTSAKGNQRFFGRGPLIIAVVPAILVGAAVAMYSLGAFQPSSKAPTQSESEAKIAAVPSTATPEVINPITVDKSAASNNATAKQDGAQQAPPPVENSEKAASIAPNPPRSSDDIASLERLRPAWWSDCKSDVASTAISACSKLIEAGGIEGGELAEAYEKLAYAQRRDGQLDNAIASFSKSISVAESSVAYNERGTAFYLKGQKKDAVADYDRAIAFDPQNGEAFNNRAWANYELGLMTQAKSDADKAALLAPADANVWDTRGHILEALGEPAEAVKSFKKALSIDPALQSSDAGLKRLENR